MKTLPDPTVEEISAQPIAQGLSASECEVIASMCERHIFQAEEVVFNEGDIKRDLLILIKGAIRITKTNDGGKQKTLATVQSPAVLGEIGMVLGGPRTATGTAHTEVEAIVLNGKSIQKLLAQDDLAAFKASYNAVKELALRQNRMNQEALRLMEELENRPSRGDDDVTQLREKLLKEWTF